MAKRLILRVDQPTAVHDHRLQPELRSHYDTPLFHGVLEPITHSRQDIEVPPKKVYPWGAPPRVSSHGQTPHVMSLHQSTPFLTSLNHLARSASPHSSLISYPVHHGEFASVDCSIFRADCHAV